MKKDNLEKIQRAQIEAAEQANLNRARGVTVGTCFGGTIELSMRHPNGTVIWTPLQPVEAIELIHQLAASVGCHLILKPRNDFASWRQWRNIPGVDIPSAIATDVEKAIHIASQLAPPEQQPGLQPALMVKKQINEQAVVQKQIKQKAKKTSNKED